MSVGCKSSNIGHSKHECRVNRFVDATNLKAATRLYLVLQPQGKSRKAFPDLNPDNHRGRVARSNPMPKYRVSALPTATKLSDTSA